MIDVLEAPDGVRRECVANAVCVQFYGPSASKSRDRDYCWADASRLAPYPENVNVLTNQNVPKRLRPSAFREACEEAEALFREHGNNVSALHVDDALAHHLEPGDATLGEDAENVFGELSGVNRFVRTLRNLFKKICIT